MDSVRCVLGLLLLIVGYASCQRGTCAPKPPVVANCLKGIADTIVTIDNVSVRRPFFPATFETMNVYISPEFTTTAINYEVCCQKYYAEASVRTLVPTTGNPQATAVETRTEATLKLTLVKDDSFGDDIYSIFLVDPDAGNYAKPPLHLMITNIKNGVVDSGDVIYSYLGPSPREPQFYVFLVYKQAAELTVTATDVKNGYTTGCDRCLFNILQFVSDKGLTFAGTNWMLVTNSPYADLVEIQAGKNSSLYCTGKPGWVYGEECTSAAPYVQSTLFMCFTSVVAVFIKIFEY